MVFVELHRMRWAARNKGEAIKATAKGGLRWDKYFWIRYAGF